jgi:hypothetical protein
VWFHDPVPQEIVLHLGVGRTGTSSVQHLLGANREALGAHGVLYPRTPGRARHTRLGMFAKSDTDLVRTGAWQRMGRPDPVRFRRRFRRRLLQEVMDGAPDQVVFSDEGLFGLPDDAIRRLRRLTQEIGGDVRLVAYLRRQEDRLASRYQQEVQVGATRRLADWASTYGTQLHDYHRRLSAWRDALAPSTIVARRFERSAFVDGSLYADFLDAAGIDLTVDQLTTVETRNESLDAETVEFLRLLNLDRIENQQSRPVDNTAVVARLREEHLPGPVLTLPDSALDRERERWQQSNAATAVEFLEDADGILFREPRRTSDTTTVQLLEPARLDYFAELVELPGEVHDALRVIVEREAKEGEARA